MKLFAIVLSQTLPDDINNSISKTLFPDNATVFSVSPAEKQSNDKSKVSNFRPASALNMSSKIFESVIKNKLKNGEKISTKFKLNLSKAFDCIRHDVLIGELSAYGFKINAWKYIYTYLKNLKQRFHINNVSTSKTILEVVQASIVGSVSFNAF